ncbi:hypothetical protein [Streptomyces sp. NK08204]|uniref:hypothetical protein n=1 Tax=Streptomyces sp. NK08204 TaxID=2873260 RepID=UPI001CEC8E1E|nr:hypothetical protein [Streptomyces sp. NK08204]
MTSAALDLTAADLSQVTEIVLARSLWTHIVAHAVRKLTGYYLEGEYQERKAFGMLAGRQTGTRLQVTAVFPLLSNLRHDSDHRGDMDQAVQAHAIPSETPLDQRGWMADPRELFQLERACRGTDWVIFGNYHTHRVPWPHDPVRDSCTDLDRVLATGSGQWTFILSAVDLHTPRLRAFFEGDNGREAPISILPG